jgi:hypothetical protein
MQKERLARGWSLREFAARTGINYSTASLIENGKRPPTEKAAAACDDVFPDRRGWFTEYCAELQEWSEVPAAFKDWTEREDKASALRVWSPGIVHAGGGFVYSGETVTALERIFDTVRSECHKASESLALLERLAEAWRTGGKAPTAGPTAEAV